jgi:hypothetical protein
MGRGGKQGQASGANCKICYTMGAGVGGWRLEVGGQRLEVGGWRLEGRGRRLYLRSKDLANFMMKSA